MAITVTFQPDGTNGLDTYIDSYQPTVNYGTTTTFVLGNLCAWLVDFNLRAQGLSKKLYVVSAYITLIHSRAISCLTNFDLKHCLRNWVESQATWNIYSTGNSWQTAGAQGALDSELILAEIPIGYKALAGVAVKIPLPPSAITRQLQDSSVYGWVLASNVNNYIDLVVPCSSDNGTVSYRPSLTITYEPYHKIFPISAGLGQVR